MKFSVVIPTYNRAAQLPETLRSLAAITSPGEWEVIVVDNNSTDDTAATLAIATRDFPVALRVVTEQVQGRSAALNAGIAAATGDAIALTDDDLRFEKDWLLQASAGLERFDCAYVGGRILPFWEAPMPSWFSPDSARQRAVLAMSDYGDDSFEYARNPALGCNMVVRREAFDRVGLWDNSIGRRAGTLLGQEVREWCWRARKAGLSGFYLPDMIVHHVVPADRLTTAYFRRWFYWHGISRALLYRTSGLDMESPEDGPMPVSEIPHIAGVPRYLYRTALASAGKMLRAYARGDGRAAFDEQLWLFFFAGIVKQRVKDRGIPIAAPMERGSHGFSSSSGSSVQNPDKAIT